MQDTIYNAIQGGKQRMGSVMLQGLGRGDTMSKHMVRNTGGKTNERYIAIPASWQGR